MASSALAAPGTEYGPCTEPCGHTDCRTAREIAESACLICEEPIGFDRHFYNCSGAEGKGFAHAACYEEAVVVADRPLRLPEGRTPPGVSYDSGARITRRGKEK